MEISTIATYAELIFTVIGIVVIVGTIVIKATSGESDDNWWNNWVLR